MTHDNDAVEMDDLEFEVAHVDDCDVCYECVNEAFKAFKFSVSSYVLTGIENHAAVVRVREKP